MQFEWDEKKAASNLHKHRIRFEQATKAFSDPYRIEIEDDAFAESRYQLIGVGFGNLLVVIYTWRDDRVRIISARKANNHERRAYYSI